MEKRLNKKVNEVLPSIGDLSGFLTKEDNFEERVRNYLRDSMGIETLDSPNYRLIQTLIGLDEADNYKK